MATESTTPILVAYDGSPSAESAVEAAAALFQGRPVVVLSVWRSVAEAAPASLVALPRDVAREAYQKLDRAAENKGSALAEQGAESLRRLGVDAIARAVRLEWNAWSSILEVADELDAAAVVVGSRGLSGVKSALLGSVSNGVVHHSTRPVLVVHPRETTDDVPG